MIFNNLKYYISVYYNKLYQYNDVDALKKAFEDNTEINYILVPRTEFIGYTIKNNYYLSKVVIK